MKNLLSFCAYIVVILASPEPEKNIFCVHGQWAYYRIGNGQFGIAQINPFLCTHLIYTYFGLDTEGSIVITDNWLDLEENYGFGNLKKLNRLKEINPRLKILASIGGWVEGSEDFSRVAHNDEKRETFVQNTMNFLTKHGFDGLNLDWVYRGQPEESKTSDKEAYTVLVRSLSRALQSQRLILTAVVAPEQHIADAAYDIPQISKYLEFILLRTFDMHGSWGIKIGIHSPLYPNSKEENFEKSLNIDSAVFFWLRSRVPSQKLIIGIPTYARGFKMISKDLNTPGSPHDGPTQVGPYSNDPGFIGFNEFCEMRLTEDWKDFWDHEQLVPYSTREDQWLGFDNEESIRLKVRYVKRYKLGGVMVGNIETDDFKGFCGRGKFPLLNEIKKALKAKDPNDRLSYQKMCQGDRD